MALVAKKAALAGAGLHAACTLASLGADFFLGGGQRPEEEGGGAPVPARVLACVQKQYAGEGLDRGTCRADVVFEDPAARCSGVDEVAEAFRALRACSPESLRPPRAQARAGAVTVLLDQRYFGFLRVESELVVSLDSQGKISRLEERWNGAPLLGLPPVTWARRLNGMLSFALTSRLL